MTAEEIVSAFVQQNENRSWEVQAYAGRTVHFTGKGLISLIYEVETGLWRVKFNKFQASWGDYIKAIARSFHTVLNTLKRAGLPVDAPPTHSGIEIIATSSDDNTVFVRWPAPPKPLDYQPMIDWAERQIARDTETPDEK